MIRILTFTLLPKIQDDHGFSSLVFHYKVGAPGENETGKAHLYTLPVKADLSQPLAGFFYYWNLKRLWLNTLEGLGSSRLHLLLD